MPQLDDFEEVEDYLDFSRRPSKIGNKVFALFEEHTRLTPRQIYILVKKEVSRVTIHRQLKRLVIKKLLHKEGKAPHVVYWREKIEEPF